jgi:hypothetical protein
MIAAISVRGVPSAELSVASASNRTALQIGNAVGIAVVIAVLGDPRGQKRSGPSARPGSSWASVRFVTALAIASVETARRAFSRDSSALIVLID